MEWIWAIPFSRRIVSDARLHKSCLNRPSAIRSHYRTASLGFSPRSPEFVTQGLRRSVSFDQGWDIFTDPLPIFVAASANRDWAGESKLPLSSAVFEIYTAAHSEPFAMKANGFHIKYEEGFHD